MLTCDCSVYITGSQGLGWIPPAADLSGVSLTSETHTALSGDNPLLKSPTDETSTPANLLPLNVPGSSIKVAEVYVGECLPPVPERLAAKIRAWKFVEMAEMLQEHWLQESYKEEGAPPGSTRHNHQRCHRKVTGIITWLQSYGLYVSMLASHSPEAISELMAYMVTMLRASQDFARSAWLTYDLAFRWQVEVTGDVPH